MVISTFQHRLKSLPSRRVPPYRYCTVNLARISIIPLRSPSSIRILRLRGPPGSAYKTKILPTTHQACTTKEPLHFARHNVHYLAVHLVHQSSKFKVQSSHRVTKCVGIPHSFAPFPIRPIQRIIKLLLLRVAHPHTGRPWRHSLSSWLNRCQREKLENSLLAYEETPESGRNVLL
jgi:hypothetical protein